MAYISQNFKDGDVLMASQLRHIEDGILTLENTLHQLGNGTNEIPVGTEILFTEAGYLGSNGEIVKSDNTGTTDYIALDGVKSIYYHGRMGYLSNTKFYAIAFYDVNKNFIASKSIEGTGNVETLYIVLNNDYADAAYVRGSWSKGSLNDSIVAEFMFMINGKPAPKKKTFAVLCDSIGTHGTSGDYSNLAEIEIMPEDVGVELNAYLTYYDVHTGGGEKANSVGDPMDFELGGKVYTEQDNGKLITFTPTSDDIGKKVGKVYNWNPNSLKTWWLWLAEAYNLEPLPVCWASSAISSHESGTDNPTDGLQGGRVKNAYAWHESQIRKCGIRTPGTMNRTAPDYIIIARGTNDWSHASGTLITKDYFADPESWVYPTTDKVDSYYGIKEAVSMTIKNMRAAYPKAKIFLCTIPYNTRGNKTTFPRSFGGKSFVSFNRAIKECAEFFGTGLIDFAACGVTHENVNLYTEDGVHLNAEGHKLAGLKSIVDFANYESKLIYSE
jgi:lysophospholipase L1-like esterase